MKTFLLPIALATMAVSAIASAQTPPPSSSSSGSSTTSPSSSSMGTPSTSGSSSYSTGDASKSQQMKDCIAKQKATDSQISDTEAKRLCSKTE